MIVLSAEEVRLAAPIANLISALNEAFRAGVVAPKRLITQMPGADDRLLLAMPAFETSGLGVIKLSTVIPSNRGQKLPSIQGIIVVFSECGTPIAVLDGGEVTRLRTGAASALASQYLSRQLSSQLVIVGTGALAPYMAAAHCAVRPITNISVFGRKPEAVQAAICAMENLVPNNVKVKASQNLADDVAQADIVSCATASSTPVIAGKWLRPGTFVDLVGSFSPEKREADDEVVRRARIFVDTFEGVLSEAGDILDPMSRGVISRKRLEGELADLVRGRVNGRLQDDEITLFKSVGTAIEDLAAAKLILGF